MEDQQLNQRRTSHHTQLQNAPGTRDIPHEMSIVSFKKIVYSEHIPIFDGISFQNYADQIHSTDGPDEKWLQAAEQLFADEPGLEKRRPYST